MSGSGRVPCSAPRELTECEARYLRQRGWSYRRATGAWTHAAWGTVSGNEAARIQSETDTPSGARAAPPRRRADFFALMALAAAGEALVVSR